MTTLFDTLLLSFTKCVLNPIKTCQMRKNNIRKTKSTSASMREASGKLYVSQPALSATIRDLEEIGIRIFERTNKGIKLTEEGNAFLSLAKQAVSQYELVESKYLHAGDGKDYYTIAMQHYVFALHAFVNSIQKRGSDSFSYLILLKKQEPMRFCSA